MRKLLIIILIFFLIGCGRYDGLIVEDGDGNLYELKSRFGSIYVVTPLNKDNTSFAETNKRLLERNKAK